MSSVFSTVFSFRPARPILTRGVSEELRLGGGPEVPDVVAYVQRMAVQQLHVGEGQREVPAVPEGEPKEAPLWLFPSLPRVQAEGRPSLKLLLGTEDVALATAVGGIVASEATLPAK